MTFLTDADVVARNDMPCRPLTTGKDTFVTTMTSSGKNTIPTPYPYTE